MTDLDNNAFPASQKYHVEQIMKTMIDEQPFRESQRDVLDKMIAPLKKIESDMTKINTSVSFLKWGLPIVVLVIQVLMETYFNMKG